MYYLIKSTATPIVWVLMLMASGLLVAWFLRRKRNSFVAWPFVIAAGLVLYFFSIPAVSNRLVYSLERQHYYPGDEVFSDLDLLVVLGAGYRPSGGLRESAEPTGLAYSRVFGGVRAFKKSHARSLVFCEGRQEQTAESGAAVMKAYAVQLGVQEDDVITEESSQNTMDNAVQLKKLLPEEGQSRIGIVTSALHMPRSLRVFKRVFPQGMIVPVPVGYRFDHRKTDLLKNLTPSSGALQASTDALQEWIGMLWYAIRY